MCVQMYIHMCIYIHTCVHRKRRGEREGKRKENKKGGQWQKHGAIFLTTLLTSSI